MRTAVPMMMAAEVPRNSGDESADAIVNKVDELIFQHTSMMSSLTTSSMYDPDGRRETKRTRYRRWVGERAKI